MNVPENKEVSLELEIPCKDLAFYDESIGDWNLEKGTYLIYVGNASNNISQIVEIAIR